MSLVLLTLTAAALAQYGASVEGTVFDSTGAVVAGATVNATNQATGVKRSTVTNGSGFYHIPGLVPGTYTIEGEAANFQKTSTPNVQVAAEVPRGLDITLQLGSAQQSVTVTETVGAGLQTENANVTQTITSQQVVNLPQFGRDPYELIRLTPGVFADASRQANGNSQEIPQQVGPGGSNSQIFQTENQVQAIANGQRVSANNFMLDGVSTNSLSWGGAAVVTPNQESVQEVIVSSDSYSAQDGRNSGAQVKVISKNGTNDLHGSGFFKLNDKGLNAFNKFYGPTDVPQQTLTCEANTPDAFQITASRCPGRVNQKYRQFAASLGGPIVKNKLFFFGSYEGVRLNSSSLLRDVKLETPEFEQYVQQVNPGSIAAQIFAAPGITPRISTTTSVTDCCSLDPTTHPLGTWYVPGIDPGQAIGAGPDGIPDWGMFDIVEPNSNSGDQFNGRLDFTQGSHQFFASTYMVRLNNVAGGQRPLEDVTLRPRNYVGTVGWNWTIGATMLNEARANFTRFEFDQRTPEGTTNFGIPQIRLFDFDAGGLGDAGRIIGIERGSTTPGALAQNTLAFADTLSLVRNRHTWKFGVEIRREQNNNDQPGGERPDYQFRGLLNFANDACCFFEQLSVDPTGGRLNSKRYFRTSNYAAFIQDDWKVFPSLTLNLGLRWEYFSPDKEEGNQLSNYIFGSQGVINGRIQTTNRLFHPDWNNFGPRVGFAWSPTRYSGKVVFRGGFGLLYNRHFGTIFDNVRQNTPFFAEVATDTFFDPGMISGPPPDSGIVYTLGANTRADSYPVNPNFAFGVAPDGALCADSTCTDVTPVAVFGALPEEPNPYVYVFSFENQTEIAPNLVMKIGYQGSRSRKLIRTIDLNRLQPGDTFDADPMDKFQSVGSNGEACGPTNPTCLAPHAVGNPRFQNIFVPLPDVNASYDAGVFNLGRRFSHGFQIDATYTWSHAVDTASYEIGYQQTDPSNQEINRADSDFDVRQNFVLAAVWELPLFRGRHNLAGAMLGGWTVSGIMSKHSGFPFGALVGTCDPNADRNGDGYCPDLPFAFNGGQVVDPSKRQWINGIFPDPNAEFDSTTQGPGCRCRNIFRGPGYTSVDLAVGKEFAFPKMPVLGEAAKLAIRANFFNALNILNLSPLIPATAPTDILNTTDFGRAPDGLAGRVIEFQARLSF